MDQFKKYLFSVLTSAFSGSETHDYLNACKSLKDYPVFSSAENAFFNLNYAAALKLYLEAEEVPLLRFFCYRAAAFLCEAEGNDKLAVSYCEKTLEGLPHDYFILNLYVKLLLKTKRSRKAKKIWHTISLLKTRYSSQSSKPASSFTVKDFNELRHIFKEPVKETLFVSDS